MRDNFDSVCGLIRSKSTPPTGPDPRYRRHISTFASVRGPRSAVLTAFETPSRPRAAVLTVFEPFRNDFELVLDASGPFLRPYRRAEEAPRRPTAFATALTRPLEALLTRPTCSDLTTVTRSGDPSSRNMLALAAEQSSSPGRLNDRSCWSNLLGRYCTDKINCTVRSTALPCDLGDGQRVNR